MAGASMMAVKFSMIFEAQMADPSRETEQQVIRDCVDQAVLAEEVGLRPGVGRWSTTASSGTPT